MPAVFSSVEVCGCNSKVIGFSATTFALSYAVNSHAHM
jgi:hypothetical protein